MSVIIAQTLEPKSYRFVSHLCEFCDLVACMKCRCDSINFWIYGAIWGRLRDSGLVSKEHIIILLYNKAVCQRGLQLLCHPLFSWLPRWELFVIIHVMWCHSVFDSWVKPQHCGFVLLDVKIKDESLHLFLRLNMLFIMYDFSFTSTVLKKEIKNKQSCLHKFSERYVTN